MSNNFCIILITEHTLICLVGVGNYTVRLANAMPFTDSQCKVFYHQRFFCFLPLGDIPPDSLIFDKSSLGVEYGTVRPLEPPLRTRPEITPGFRRYQQASSNGDPAMQVMTRALSSG